MTVLPAAPLGLGRWLLRRLRGAFGRSKAPGHGPATSSRRARRLCPTIHLEGWDHLIDAIDPDRGLPRGVALTIAHTPDWPTALEALDHWAGPVDLLVASPRSGDPLGDLSLEEQGPRLRGELLQTVDLELLAERLRGGARIAALETPSGGTSRALHELLRDAASTAEVARLDVRLEHGRPGRHSANAQLVVSPSPS